MNKRKLALLAALPAAVLMANNAMAGVDVYGKINISLQKNTANQDDGLATLTNGDIYNNWTLDSNASRIGFKSSTDLGDTGLKGVAKLEYGADADDGTTVFAPRNIYAGVQGGFGTIIAGKFDTPMKESQGKVDQFNDYILGDIANVLTIGEDRASNIVMYSTPKYDSGIGFNIAIMPGEESGLDNKASGANNVAKKNSGPADYISANIHYDSDALYLALAHNTASGATALPTTVNSLSGVEITRLVAQVKVVDALVLGAIYQQAKSADNNNDYSPTNGVGGIGIYGSSNTAGKMVGPFGSATNWSTTYKDQDGYIVSAAYTMGNHVFKTQYGASKSSAIQQTVATGYTKDGDLNIKLFDIGYDYKLGKDATVYAYYADYGSRQKNALNVKREINANTVAIGYEQKF